MISNVLNSLPNRRLAGALTYRYSPSFGRNRWGGPLNGQKLRCLLIADLISTFQPHWIVETGAYLGATTEWLSAFQIPILTCEGNEWNYGFAQSKLSNIESVALHFGDSRDALKLWAENELNHSSDQAVLFYLDAHWEEDLPLAEELDIVFSSFDRAIVMVDDFQVEGDEGYGYDDYGPGKALDFAYIQEAVNRFGLKIFYPRRPSSLETGGRRGCAVIAKSEADIEVMRSISMLKERSPQADH